MGNRLITAFAAVQYARSNGRSLVIDWCDGQFDEKHINAFDKCFEIKGMQLYDAGQIDRWQEKTHSSVLLKQGKDQGVYELFKQVQSDLYSKLPLRFFPKGAIRKLRRRWEPLAGAGSKNALNFGSDLKNHLPEDIVYYIDFLPDVDYTDLPLVIQPKAAIVKKINDFSMANNLDALTGIHIRYTDKKPTKNISTVIDHLKSKNINALFLATDSPYIEGLFKEQFKQVVLFPKFKPELKNEGLHQWALYNNAEQMKYSMYEESVVEMFLLSRCQHLFYQGNSSFSNVSKVYHNNKNNCLDWQKL